MTKQVQRRRGTSTQHTSFTGAEGEISVNTTNKSIHVHDGVTAGGIETARADMTNVSDANLNARLNGNTLASLTITSADINGGTIDGTTIGGTTPAIGTFTQATVTGDLTIVDKIVHSGDTNTSIRFPAADTVTVETGGTERMRITSTGNLVFDTDALFVDATNDRVGINNAAPATTLDVGGSIYFSSVLRATGGGSAATPSIQIGNDSDTGLFHPAANNIGFSTLGTERMRIDSSGNVGIGTSSPLAKLDVDEVAPIFGDGRTANSSKFWRPRVPTFAGTNTGNDWFTPIFVVATSGSNLLEIGGGTSTAYAATEIRFRTAVNETTTTGTERMRITSSGNVGIGTSSPTSVVHVASATSSKFQLQSTSGVGGGFIAWHDNLGVRNKFIGTTSSAADDLVIWQESAASLRLATANTERMRIDASGNVGIGETAPDYKLDVNGAIGFAPGASVTPVDNGDVVFELTNNTTLTIKAKGSDGVVRSATIILV